MDEDEIRQLVQEIVRDELAKSREEAQYSVTRVPAHIHNNMDAPNLPPHSVAGFLPLPGTGSGVLALAANQSVSGPPADNSILNPPAVYVFPVPVIYAGGGGAAAFNAGTAPNGAMLFFDTGSKVTSALWVKTLNGWYGITPDSTA